MQKISNSRHTFRICPATLNDKFHLDYPECRLTDIGDEYLGSLSTTVSGEACDPWDSPGSAHPEQGNITSCWNPDLRQSGPWCYVDALDGVTENCDVPFCKRKTFAFLEIEFGNVQQMTPFVMSSQF